MAAKTLLLEGRNGLVLSLGKYELTKGVHTGTFMGIPPTGKSVVVRMATFDRVVDGKIVSSEVIMDTAGLLIQLGVMEPPTGL
jgi:predicted ester cyclase